ncbi:MAG: polysaccharide biosynthesis protein, partial [Bacteroidales bacterium]|nr:polysaccharide biosynthesis protein [Bacteroidales bacterium]
MQDTTSNNKRIAKNTIMLYIRMFISMVVGLYTSRVVLATLGVEDYGIYGVVGGVVGMMGFLNASMSGATSRFLTFELGKGDKERLAKTFSSALIVHIAIAIIVFILAETVGLWFLCNKLNIPEGRMEAAHWVYQFSILATMLSITQVPYNATIIAHEKMNVYAYMEILNVSLKLLIVYLLTIGDFDKLKLYAVLTFAVSLIIMMIYRIYCLRHFKESRFHWVWDKTYLTPLLSFSGWNLYGNFGGIAGNQANNFVINSFFGVVMNAAASVAFTVSGIVTQFSSNAMTAFRPQII